MNLNHLREFLVFSETCNYTAAAKQLFIAQPTLIQHIQKLEKELGFQLVTHDGNPRLTELGVFFGANIEQSLAVLDNAISWCRNREREMSSRIRIINQQVLFDPDFFDASLYDGSAPHLSFVNFQENDHSEFEILDANLVDFSALMAASAELPSFEGVDMSRYGFVKLDPMSCVALVSRSSALASRRTVRLADFNGRSLVSSSGLFYADNGNLLEDELRKRGISMNPIRVPSENVYHLLKSNPSYLSIFVDRAEKHRRMALRDDDLVAVPIASDELILHPWAIYRLDNPNPAVAEFASHWRDFLSSRG